ncbi:aplycalcin, partial [Trichinella spiralis]|uniref:aplycalcin n=1 Tax=Trichinella spiralis TaxID=6334 RepID=UPI0001EFDA3D
NSQAIYKQFFPNGDPNKIFQFCFQRIRRKQRAFSLYDLDNDGYITKNEMVEIVDSIYAMLGKFVDNKDFPMDDSPQLRVEKIFQSMDSNKDNKLSKDEFIAGSKKDAWIVKALTIGNCP